MADGGLELGGLEIGTVREVELSELSVLNGPVILHKQEMTGFSKTNRPLFGANDEKMEK